MINYFTTDYMEKNDKTQNKLREISNKRIYYD